MDAMISAFLFWAGTAAQRTRFFFLFCDSSYCHPETCRIPKGKIFLPPPSLFRTCVQKFSMDEQVKGSEIRRERGAIPTSRHLLTLVPIGSSA